MKKTSIFLAWMMVLFISGCSAPIQDAASPAAEIIEIQAPNIGKEVGINDNIVPLYLPQKLSNGKEIQQCILSKNKDNATISTGGTILVEICYTQDVQDFPELGKAEIIAHDGEYTLNIRLDSQMACILKGSGIAKDELIRIAESFYFETGPTPNMAEMPSNEQKIEDSITAYEELTPAIRVVLEYIEKKKDSPYGIIAYQQTALEEGTLVLAEGLHDGENHPELYYVDEGNAIQNCTKGSNCWEMNFTELFGKRIYYGHTYSEVPVTEVTLRYNGASAGATPHSPGGIAVKNAVKETADFIENVQGYILVTERKDMPVSFDIKKEDGKEVNILEERLQSTPIPSYEDVDDPSIRYASLFQNNLMTEPEDPSAPDKIGRISLQSDKNQQQLVFAGFFKDVPLQELFSSLSVYALCSNYMFESEHLPAGSKVKLVSDKSFSEDAVIQCYFSRLTKETWNIYKKTGSVDFLRTMRAPDILDHIELLDSPGYYLIAVCVDDPDIKTGKMIYTGVIGLD